MELKKKYILNSIIIKNNYKTKTLEENVILFVYVI